MTNPSNENTRTAKEMTDALANQLWKEHIERLDSLYYDPVERAQGVHNIVEKQLEFLHKQKLDIPTQWDMLCYAVQYVVMMSKGMNDEELTFLARKLNSKLFNIHYSNAEKMYPVADKKRDREATTPKL